MTETAVMALDRALAAERTGRSFDPAPVRIAHIGLGAFHRAHQAWYTHAVDERREWGIRAFTGRSAAAADALAAQDGLYSLIERSASGDAISLIDSIVDAVDGARIDVLTETLADPATAIVTLTITEAGYALDIDGAPDTAQTVVAADVEWLRTNLGSVAPATSPTTALARLLFGLDARRRAGAGAIAVVSCDNLPGNGAITRAALLAWADLVGASETSDYLRDEVSFPSTSIDRITPRTTDAEIELVRERTGWDDRSPVVTEPFRDWIISGDFPAGRPEWERAGVRFVDDIDPFERRKLWMLNGAHSFLAYAGPAFGHETVAQAIGDERIRGWVNELWDEDARHLAAPHVADSQLGIADYRIALLERFDNARIQHLLAQIGQDGVAKLRARIVDVLLAERAAGRDGAACVRVLGAWVARARAGALPADANAAAVTDALAEGTASALLAVIDERLAAPGIVAAVEDAAAEFSSNLTATEES